MKVDCNVNLICLMALWILGEESCFTRCLGTINGVGEGHVVFEYKSELVSAFAYMHCLFERKLHNTKLVVTLFSDA